MVILFEWFIIFNRLTILFDLCNNLIYLIIGLHKMSDKLFKHEIIYLFNKVIISLRIQSVIDFTELIINL